MFCIDFCVLSFPGFAASDEAGPVERLLDAYDQGDQQAADQITKSPLFRFMENDVSLILSQVSSLSS